MAMSEERAPRSSKLRHVFAPSHLEEAQPPPALVFPGMASPATQRLPRQGRLPPTVARRSLVPAPLRRRTLVPHLVEGHTANPTNSTTLPRIGRLRSLVARISLVPAPLRTRRQRTQDPNPAPPVTPREEERLRRSAERHYANTLALLEGREEIDWLAEGVDDDEREEEDAPDEQLLQAEQPPILSPSSPSPASTFGLFHDTDECHPLPLFSSPSSNVPDRQRSHAHPDPSSRPLSNEESRSEPKSDTDANTDSETDTETDADTDTDVDPDSITNSTHVRHTHRNHTTTPWRTFRYTICGNPIASTVVTLVVIVLFLTYSFSGRSW